MSSVEPVRQSAVRRRVLSACVAFIVAASAIYSIAWVSLGLLRHIVMPIVAVIIAGYFAVRVFQFTGRERSRPLVEVSRTDEYHAATLHTSGNKTLVFFMCGPTWRPSSSIGQLGDQPVSSTSSSAAIRGLVDVANGTRIRCSRDSLRGRFDCSATAFQAIAALVPAFVRSGGAGPSGHRSEHRSAGRRTSIHWSPGHGARLGENPIAVLQVIPRSPLIEPARRLPSPFTARCHLLL